MLKNILNRRKCVVEKYHRYFAKSISNHSNNENINYQDVEHHSKMKDHWWNLNGPVKGLHSLNELRVPFIRDGLVNSKKSNKENKFTSKPLRDFKLLEVGCGGGILTEPLARLGADVVGLDASAELISVAETHKMQSENMDKILYTTNCIEEYSNNNKECFDAVIVSEVLEHIKDKNMFIASCLKTLRPKGSIFITTINKSFMSWLCGIIIAERLLNIVPNNTHEWDLFIQPHETQRILEINNCHIQKLHGMFYQVWNNSWSWCSNTDINYAVHAIKNIEDSDAYHDN
ncbi:ubiquinone biosynthesis O-methyltransferase, mitochondrial [Ctenocephalides felis]|uniref:ubiquinone biosynthesis O-methyltransferase, mitochondrial n=1 Tax=Ctenocephalides felis TaxID=7515 RepID=UPI000E6E11CE|nr:ubiquinone biosynthesis O-methyltransferase, mitochondrial [Ctenocephalides felis]